MMSALSRLSPSSRQPPAPFHAPELVRWQQAPIVTYQLNVCCLKLDSRPIIIIIIFIYYILLLFLQYWAKRWLVLLRCSSRGPLRLAVYSSNISVERSHQPERVVLLSDFTMITRIQLENCPAHQFGIAIRFISGQFLAFSTDTGRQFAIYKQEKPTNCGTRAADVLTICQPVNFNANQLNTEYFGTLATTMT